MGTAWSLGLETGPRSFLSFLHLSQMGDSSVNAVATQENSGQIFSTSTTTTTAAATPIPAAPSAVTDQILRLSSATADSIASTTYAFFEAQNHHHPTNSISAALQDSAQQHHQQHQQHQQQQQLLDDVLSNLAKSTMPPCAPSIAPPPPPVAPPTTVTATAAGLCVPPAVVPPSLEAIAAALPTASSSLDSLSSLTSILPSTVTVNELLAAGLTSSTDATGAPGAFTDHHHTHAHVHTHPHHHRSSAPSASAILSTNLISTALPTAPIVLDPLLHGTGGGSSLASTNPSTVLTGAFIDPMQTALASTMVLASAAAANAPTASDTANATALLHDPATTILMNNASTHLVQNINAQNVVLAAQYNAAIMQASADAAAAALVYQNARELIQIRHETAMEHALQQIQQQLAPQTSTIEEVDEKVASSTEASTNQAASVVELPSGAQAEEILADIEENQSKIHDALSTIKEACEESMDTNVDEVLREVRVVEMLFEEQKATIESILNPVIEASQENAVNEMPVPVTATPDMDNGRKRLSSISLQSDLATRRKLSQDATTSKSDLSISEANRSSCMSVESRRDDPVSLSDLSKDQLIQKVLHYQEQIDVLEGM